MKVHASQLVKALSLEVLAPSTREELEFEAPDQNRPGLQFSGYFKHFACERMQIIGRAEMTYLDTLSAPVRAVRLREFFEYEMPCVVICRDLGCPDDVRELAAAHDIPVYGSKQRTARFQNDAMQYLSNVLAPRQTIHGVLVDVHGVGVLITGESGVGKSEAALELVKRGHQLVADDVVDIRRVSETRLVGESPEMIRYFMEIRGIGIIDIRAMYGIGAVIPSKSIDLVIHLEHWVRERNYDRLGMVEESTEILEVNVPRIVLPVRPGRNLAIVIEVAARNLSLRKLGYNAAKTLDERLIEMAGKGGAQ